MDTHQFDLRYLNIAFLVLFFGFATGFTQDIEVKSGEPFFTFDENTGEFHNIIKSKTTVDSLLALGNRIRNLDSRKSFLAAREAFSVAKEIGYVEGEAGAHNLGALMYSVFGDYDHAMEHYLEAMKIWEKLENDEEIANLYNNIALIHIEQQNYIRATELLELSISLRRELGMDNQVYLALNNLGVVFRRLGDYDNALTHFKESERLSLEAASDTLTHMIATLNIGNTYRNKGDLGQAEDYLYKADSYFKESGNISFQSASSLILGQFYRDRGDYDMALIKAGVSLDLAADEMLRERVKNAHELFSDLYETIGNYEKAYQHFKAYHEIHDTLLGIQRSNQINEMQILFDVEQKDREIQLLNQEFALQQAEIDKQKLWQNFLILGLISFAFLGAILYKYNLQRKRANQLLAEKNREILIKNKQLILLNKDKDEFLGMAAHDLRSPLSGVKACISLISEADSFNEEEVHQYAGMIEVSVDRMVAMIDNLLDVNALENGVNNLNIAPVDIYSAVERNVKNFKKIAEKKNIDLSVRIDPDTKPVMADEEAVERILENLISNAIKFSPEESKVEISTRLDRDQVELVVIDNGPGIPESEQKKLFKRFSRLSTRPTGNESSTGLGLFIVKKLVEAMNGTVQCKSTQGRGTSFIVTMPVAA